MTEVIVEEGLDRYRVDPEERRMSWFIEDPQARVTSVGRVEYDPEHTTVAVGDIRVRVGSRVTVEKWLGKDDYDQFEMLYEGRPLE